MRILIAFMAGIATAWTTFFIWHRLPALPDIEWTPEQLDIIEANRREFERMYAEPWFTPRSPR